ncbi:MAG: hypothetical protein EXS14_10775, partial [Planctomycetes bacterium]|nr:hypothetical protein [Planctomycetota bacterium]
MVYFMKLRQERGLLCNDCLSSNRRSAPMQMLLMCFVMSACVFALIPNQGVGQWYPPAPHSAQISAGVFHTLALRSDGTVMAWGWNAYGQLGLGNNTNQYTPQQIPGLTLAPADLQLTAAATATLGTQWLMSLTRNY